MYYTCGAAHISRAKFFVSTLCFSKFWSMLKHVGSILDTPEIVKKIKKQKYEKHVKHTKFTNKGMLNVIVRKIFSTENSDFHTKKAHIKHNTPKTFSSIFIEF